ncbi:hypothetical protein GCM10009662_09800 [Catellatospora coxensis]|uniref:Uncharacterized protein n=2 Tax=Catellatospora coxensis TaxID=310354 RepID=A0A8J3L3V6_9ACTN|nr:hypothetical protein Cco03nite_76490 [Catellatospora coxensis]
MGALCRTALSHPAARLRAERFAAGSSEMDEALATTTAVGATLLKPAQKVEWGGYSGDFADPDAPVGEVAYDPIRPLDEADLREPP